MNDAEKEANWNRICDLGNHPGLWPRLNERTFLQIVYVKCLELGLTGDLALIRPLAELYREFVGRFGESDRDTVCTAIAEAVERDRGRGVQALWAPLLCDPSSSVRAMAAMSLAVLTPTKDGDELTGPREALALVFDGTRHRHAYPDMVTAVLLLGDGRVLPMLEQAWTLLDEEEQLKVTRANPEYVFAAIVEFYLRVLEKGCSEGVWGSIAAALAKLPVFAKRPVVVDVERVLPVYKCSDAPLRMLGTWSFQEYLELIRPRLERLIAIESEPRLLPAINEIWETR